MRSGFDPAKGEFHKSLRNDTGGVEGPVFIGHSGLVAELECGEQPCWRFELHFQCLNKGSRIEAIDDTMVKGRG
jgi:hypothetical protein